MAAIQRKIRLSWLAGLVFLGAIAAHYAFSPWGFYRATPEPEASLRRSYVQTAEQWLGAREADGSHKPILTLYNSQEVLPVDYAVQDTDSWCAVFVSAAALEAGITDIIPTECGCERQIGLFQALGRWEEDETSVPLPGDLIYYDWDNTKPGDARGWSDHVGIVVGTKWPFVKVIEGNRSDSVSYHILPLWEQTIRGYGQPDFQSRAGKTP